jgi:predicted nucleic acid-binding protein
MIVLVDTNVLLDVLQQREPHDAAAARVWKLAEERQITAYVAAISFNNVYYIARKQLGKAAALDAVKLVRGVFGTVPLDEAVVDAAITAGTSQDFEDSIQSISALRASANYIVTRNVDDFSYRTVPAVTADELLAIVAS